jgi:hypothetical protein
MNLNEILSNSFRYPLSNVKRMLVLGLLLATSILIVPAIFAYGYLLRIIEYSFNGSNELPPFEDWGRMFVDGLKYILVFIIYVGIPAFIAGFISVMILLAQYPRVMGVNDFLLVMGIVSIIIVAVPYILSLIAIPNMAYYEMNLSKAFEFKYLFKIIEKIGWPKYISAVVIILVFTILSSGFSFYLQSLHLSPIMNYGISGIISLFIGSYLLAFRGRLFALLYTEGAKEKE